MSRKPRPQTHVIDAAALDPITAMTADGDGRTLYAGNDRAAWRAGNWTRRARFRSQEIVPAFADQRAVTALAMIFGDVSLAVGDDRGDVTTWFTVRVDDKPTLTRIHTLTAHEGAVREIVPSTRNKTLWSLGEHGRLALGPHDQRAQSARTRRRRRRCSSSATAPQGNAVVALDDAGRTHRVALRGGSSRNQLADALRLVHYEGYDQPSFTWQTTGGDDFEPKYSLVPLLFGTLKGTFYAMLFAVPLALFGAVYTAHFTTPGLQEDGQAGRRDHGGGSVGRDRVPGGALAGPDPGAVDHCGLPRAGDDPRGVPGVHGRAGSWSAASTAPSGWRTDTNSSCWCR